MNENLGEKKERQIKNQIGLLESSGARLIDRLNNLSTRLSPALREKSLSENKDVTKQEDESLVEIALNIRGIRYSIESETKLIIDILDRLEI